MTDKEKLLELGYEDVVVFKDCDYEGALIGVSTDNRAIYDYDLMIKYLMDNGFGDVTEAIEWIEYNTIRALPYCENAPIIIQRFIV